MAEELRPLFDEIEAHLRSQPAQLKRFTFLVESFRCQTGPLPGEIHSELLKLVNNSPLLLSAVRQASIYFEVPDAPSQSITDFIPDFRVLLEDDVDFPRSITDRAALFVQGWISFNLWKQVVQRVFPDPPAPILCSFEKITNFVSGKIPPFRMPSAFLELDDQLPSRIAFNCWWFAGSV
jgi:hypothetical protein